MVSSTKKIPSRSLTTSGSDSSKKEERLMTLVDMVLDCSTLNNNEDALQFDPEKTGALDYIKTIYWDAYYGKFDEEKDLCGAGNGVVVKAKALSKDEQARVSAALFEEAEIDV